MTAPLRCGVIGFGLAGRLFHSAVISAVDGLVLTAIVERTGEAAQQTYPGARVYRSAAELLADPSIDLVSIATPNSSHAELATEALRAGKHVVVDKPLTLTSGEAGELIAIARDRKLLLIPFQNRRWDGDFLTIRALLEERTLGTLVSFESHFDRFRPQLKPDAWRERDEPGAGVLYDLGPHLVDQALVLFGKPAAVFASVRAERSGAAADDAFNLRLLYGSEASEGQASGPSVLLCASCLAALPALRFELHGAVGAYRKWGLDPQEDALRSGDLFRTSPWGVEPASSWGTLTRMGNGTPQTEPVPTRAGDYRDFYRNVRDAVRGNCSPAVTALDAWRTLRILELARRSSEEQAVLACDWSGEPAL